MTGTMWNQEVGRRFRGLDVAVMKTRTWACFDYKPNEGLWLRTADNLGPARETCIAVGAVGRTFHHVHTQPAPVCEDCKDEISQRDIDAFALEAGVCDAVPRICSDCAEMEVMP